MSGDGDEPEYFAVADPLDDSKTSYWYRPSKGLHAGTLRPWPPRVSQWGRLRQSDVPFDHRTDRVRYLAFVDTHFVRVGAARELVRRAVEADPDVAAARFAAFTVRCCLCGKILSDERSRCFGVGPDCRAGFAPLVLARFAEAVRVAHAEMLAGEASGGG